MPAHIIEAYRELVELRYQLYDRLFLTLPLDAVQQTGLWLPLIHEACTEGYEAQHDPERIISDFFQTHQSELNEDEQIRFLFKVIQYIERQVVLVDALEDAAYAEIHHMNGTGSWHQMAEQMENDRVRLPCATCPHLLHIFFPL